MIIDDTFSAMQVSNQNYISDNGDITKQFKISFWIIYWYCFRNVDVGV